jgi:hypothetical protein
MHPAQKGWLHFIVANFLSELNFSTQIMQRGELSSSELVSLVEEVDVDS